MEIKNWPDSICSLIQQFLTACFQHELIRKIRFLIDIVVIMIFEVDGQLQVVDQ